MKTDTNAVYSYVVEKDAKVGYISVPSFYADFELPKIHYCYHQFVLRYYLTTKDVNSFYMLPAPLQIERIALLKNSNVLSEVYSEDILLYNLHKISNKYDTGHSDFDFSNPSENPKAYLPLREQLIETMRKFCVLQNKSPVLG